MNKLLKRFGKIDFVFSFGLGGWRRNKFTPFCWCEEDSRLIAALIIKGICR